VVRLSLLVQGLGLVLGLPVLVLVLVQVQVPVLVLVLVLVPVPVLVLLIFEQKGLRPRSSSPAHLTTRFRCIPSIRP
jgi:hypothetical protein